MTYLGQYKRKSKNKRFMKGKRERNQKAGKRQAPDPERSSRTAATRTRIEASSPHEDRSKKKMHIQKTHEERKEELRRMEEEGQRRERRRKQIQKEKSEQERI